MTEHEQLCYLAGLFDGEGCANVYIRNGISRPTLQIQMSSLELVEKFANFFGHSIIGKSVSNKSRLEKGYKPVYGFMVQYKKAYEIAKKLAPICIEKREALQKIIEYYSQRSCTECGNAIPESKYISAQICSKECFKNRERKRRHTRWLESHV